MRVAVCGAGSPLFFIAQAILSKGYQLTIICPDPIACSRLAKEFKATVICDKPTRKQALADAALEKHQVLVALLEDDASNYLLCQQALNIFKIPRVVTLVNNPTNEPFFKRMGIQVTFSIPNIIGNLVEESLNEEVNHLQSLEEGRIFLAVVRVNENSPLIGKMLREIPVLPGTKAAAALRDGQLLAEKEPVGPGDKIITLSSPEQQGKLIRKYLGEK